MVRLCSWWVKRRVERGANVFELWKRALREDVRLAVAMGGVGVPVTAGGSIAGEGSAA